ncbi:MAG: hypothetical protein ABI759_24945 [Candidatus Solibacter sp.]
MDRSETLARDYFVHLGFDRIEYEPQGRSKPPDFLLDGRIAVEVRRLNQIETQLQATGKPRGLEEIAIPLCNTIEDLLPSFGGPTAQSWYVFIRYGRPVPSKRDLVGAVRQHLTRFRECSHQTGATLRVFDNFTIKLSPVGHSCADLFVMGGATDRDAGGWVIPELERNVQICINEKSEKISAIRSIYPEWWLVLIDQISSGREDVINVKRDGWTKIILLDPGDHTRACILQQP